MLSQTILTVSQLNRYVKSVLEEDFRLKDILLKGEISNFVDHYKSGHFYFTLKENTAAIKAVMFASYAKNVPFHPENGMEVIVRGTVSLYERDGSYQLYVYDMQPEGRGSLHLAYEQLLNKLKKEGLFDEARKKPLPQYPDTIGFVTSDTGAALHDMINIISRRYPPAKLVLYPSLVQGTEAPASLIKGLRYFNRTGSCDVIIIGRGGGSLEDLWAFNNEELVREISRSQIPVISAVGHETDFTLSDFAADLRAPTPSAAAELAVPDAKELLSRLRQKQDELKRLVRHQFFEAQQQYDNILQRESFKNWRTYLDKHTKEIEYITESIRFTAKNDILKRKAQLQSSADRVTLLNPWDRLKNGYTITQKEDGSSIGSTDQVQNGDLITTRLYNGKIISRVERIISEPVGGKK